jgi:hypothetical protein
MIFDPEIELKNIEDQPEWIGVNQKIESLQKKRVQLMAKFDKYNNDKILDLVNEVDEDLKLFESIISFWLSNYSKMDRLYKSFESSIKEVNKGSKQIDLINDLRTAYNYERKENIILSETFIELASSKGMETKKMDEALKDLRENVVNYLKHINKLLDE